MVPPSINDATGAFGGSFSVQPSTLKAIIEDTFASFRKDGFQTVYMITGHGDHTYNQVIVKAVGAASASTGMHGFVVIASAMRDRLGLKGTEPHVAVMEGPPAQAQPPYYVEVHAGGRETSILWYNFARLVKTGMLPKLPDMKFGPDDLAEWRKGGSNATRLTDAILEHVERSP